MNSIVPEIKENLNKKLKALSEILEIAKKQEKLLAEDDMENLLKGVDKRQKLIDRINRLDAERKPLMQALLKNESTPQGSFPEIEKLNQNILDILQCIQKIDSVNTAEAAMKLEEYKEKVRSARLSRKRNSSYAAPYASDDGIYIDEKK